MTQNSSGSGSNTQSLNYTTINLKYVQGINQEAVGAVVGELTAQYASSSGMTDKTDITNLARLMSATAGLLVSNGDTSAVNVAASMGANNALAKRIGVRVIL